MTAKDLRSADAAPGVEEPASDGYVVEDGNVGAALLLALLAALSGLVGMLAPVTAVQVVCRLIAVVALGCLFVLWRRGGASR